MIYFFCQSFISFLFLFKYYAYMYECNECIYAYVFISFSFLCFIRVNALQSVTMQSIFTSTCNFMSIWYITSNLHRRESMNPIKDMPEIKLTDLKFKHCVLFFTLVFFGSMAAIGLTVCTLEVQEYIQPVLTIGDCK